MLSHWLIWRNKLPGATCQALFGWIGSMRQLFKKTTEDTDPLERVKEWTRERFKLADDVPVLVAEIACGLPGCPPLETVVVFWTEGDRRHQFKLFKPVRAVVAEDLPPAWMKNALIALNGMGLECC
jgi:hypothetical protein